jgi:Pilus assembly protein, PilO
MKDKMTPTVVAALAAAAVAAVALVGWFALVAPQRSKASELDRQIADARTQLVVGKATPRGGKGSGASAIVLSRAMPRNVEMSAVLRQLVRTSHRAEVGLESVTPEASTVQTGYSTVPMTVVVTGRYAGIQRFLHALRTKAGVVGQRVHASGRLYSVDSVNLAAGEDQLPQLAATIHLNVFTYSGQTAAATASNVSTPVATTDSSTSSTRVAAGRTP